MISAVTRLAELPDDVSFADAATLGVAGLIALRIVRIAGPLLGQGSYASDVDTNVGDDLATLVDLVARGLLRPTIRAVVDWRDVGQALSGLRDRQFAGKVVLSITDSVV